MGVRRRSDGGQTEVRLGSDGVRWRSDGGQIGSDGGQTEVRGRLEGQTEVRQRSDGGQIEIGRRAYRGGPRDQIEVRSDSQRG